jgi:hypothetical protein
VTSLSASCEYEGEAYGGRRDWGAWGITTHMTHSTTPSLLHCTHLKTVRRLGRFFFATFLEAW